MYQRIAALTVLASLVCGLFPSAVLASRGTQSAPKLLNLYLDWRIKEADLPILARWDLVVLDMDLSWSAADKILALRAMNPNIKILAYVSAGELAEARARGDHASPGYKLSQVAAEGLFMHSHTGSRLTWWPGAHLMNATDLGPGVNGKHWADVLPQFVHDEMMSTGLWDGVFLDASYSDITSFYGTDIDPDGDGKTNPVASVNAAWRTGMTRLLKNMRTAVGPDRLIMVNSSVTYSSIVNGILIENFPRYGWASHQALFQDAIGKNVRPAITAYNTNTNDQNTPADYRLMRYGLTSALLGNGYYSFDAGPGGHAQAWWYDEYEAALGAATRSPQRLIGSGSGVTAGVWSRQFENGLVIVNSDKVAHKVPLSGTFETLHGTQDKKVNSGALVRSIDVPAQDGIILLGKQDVTDVRGGAFQNGSFVRVYDGQSGQPRNGFFAQRDDAPSGAQTIVTDLAQDGSTSIVTAAKGTVTVQTGSRRVTFRPFGASYVGGLSIAVGNVNFDKSLEIIVGRDKAKPSDVRTFSKEGKQLIAWTAYTPTFAGGARVAIGDLDGDGLREIVTGAGPGGGPHIRLFKTDGKVWGGSFFAFGENDRGGVSVAVGDVDGDKKAEIIVGSGEGAVPRVRIFDHRGTLKREFSLGTKPLLGGISVTAADTDGDGLAEVVVGGLPVL